MKKEESKGKFLEALAAAAGIVLTACEAVNVSRLLITDGIKKTRRLQNE